MLMSPEDTVKRAITIADLLVDELIERGWVSAAPPFTDDDEK